MSEAARTRVEPAFDQAFETFYVAEHRDRPHTREVVLHYLGTRAADRA
jgi:hypothetical protein